jgi:hypothetical protein
MNIEYRAYICAWMYTKPLSLRMPYNCLCRSWDFRLKTLTGLSRIALHIF